MVKKNKNAPVSRKSRPQNNARSVRRSQNQRQDVQLRTVSMPVVTGISYRTGRPKFTGSGGNQIVEHEEVIADLYAPASNPGNFQIPYVIRINPGLSGVFPWLSGIAAQFESYIFEYLHFSIQPSQGTAADGSLHLAIDYDSADAAPTNKVQLMAIEHAARAPPYSTVIYVSPRQCLRKRSTYYVRTDPNTGTDLMDLNLSDTGVLYIGTSGLATAGKLLGELKVKYKVKLMTPQISQSVTNAQWQVFSSNITYGTSHDAPITNFPPATKSTTWDDLCEITESGTAGELMFRFKKPGNYALTGDIGAGNNNCTSQQYVQSGIGTCVAVNSTPYDLPWPGIQSDSQSICTLLKVTDTRDAWIKLKSTVVTGAATLAAGLMNWTVNYAKGVLPNIFGLVPDPPAEGEFLDVKSVLAEFALQNRRRQEEEFVSSYHDVPKVGTPIETVSSRQSKRY